MFRGAIKHLLLLTAVLLLCVGCSAETAAKQSDANGDAAFFSFQDALGREVKLDSPPQRVVALMGGFAEIWLLAGGEETLVGATDDAFEERGFALPEGVATVGSFQNPGFEAILACSPIWCCFRLRQHEQTVMWLCRNLCRVPVLRRRISA